MKQHLETLKGILQKVLSDGSRNVDFREALGDSLYGCSLGEAALDVLMHNWSKERIPVDKLSAEDRRYQEGVQFVADVWDKIKGGE